MPSNVGLVFVVVCVIPVPSPVKNQPMASDPHIEGRAQEREENIEANDLKRN